MAMYNEEEISRMLASLKSVDAPEDFEGGVRARIARRREEPSLSRPSLVLAAKFAFPLLLLMVVTGLLILSNERELSGDLVPPVVKGSRDVAVVGGDQFGQSSVSNPNNSQIAQLSVNRSGGTTRSTSSRGSSEDIGLSPDDSTLFPDGVDPRKATITNVKPPSGGSISPVDVLLMIGISSNCTTKGCIATAIREGSIAAGAGIQAGDLISAIDGRPLSAGGIGGQFSVSELTLLRSGKAMKVPIARR